jgi:hypothetical protein
MQRQAYNLIVYARQSRSIRSFRSGSSAIQTALTAPLSTCSALRETETQLDTNLTHTMRLTKLSERTILS